MRSTLHELEVALHHETGLAWLVSEDNDKSKAVWIPKSAAELELMPNPRNRLFTVWVLTAPEQLLIDKGLV